MLNFLYLVQLVISLLLILIIMFQKAEGGTSLISSNSYNSFFANKALITNPLTRLTIILGFVFFINSILIGFVHISENKKTSNLIDQITQASKKHQETKKESNNKDVPLASK